MIPSAPASGRLPDGFTVRLNSSVRRRDRGRALVGGSPTRVLFLTDEALALLDGDTITVRDPRSRALADRLVDAGMADPIFAELAPLDPALVTFVVPVFGREEMLDRLLHSLGSGASVIVVDDLSPDRPAVAAVAAAHNATYLPLETNVGPAGARNAGLREVSTPFVAFVDSDVVVAPDALATLLRHFSDPLVALAAPRVRGLFQGRDTNWIGRYENARSSLDLGERPGLVRQRSPVSWVPSTFIVARVSALGDGFSPGMREGEDVDLVWRLADAGWRVRYEPSATVYHDHRARFGAWLGRKSFYGSSAHPLSQRHGRDIAPAVLAPWSAGVLLALLAQRRWSLPAALLISVFAAVRIAARLGRSEHPYRVAAGLTAQGVSASLTQASALLLRHWWPLALVGSLVSRRVRRAVVAAAVVDSVVEYARTRPQLDPLRFALARRLDDLAYGAGVWWGALKGRSVGALLPEVAGRSKRGGR
ncbi:mycofactocin biosynthesis glycosyltransferase MftF [Leifsonia sp. NPDC058230]|uniref:mycofactocin biosynthesis glycosyltransferase MftF n=1 Tax=Leifsonia sp. NPDC058230 TaxID=3346391 RepID=UPI0036DDB025